VAGLTTGPYGRLVAEFIRPMLMTQVALCGTHGTGLILGMNAACVVIPVIRGARMTDLADAVVQGGTGHIGAEDGGLGITPRRPWDFISDQSQVGRLLAFCGTVAPIVADRAIGDMVVFGENLRPGEDHEAENH
jgi:hypothetical protein